MIEKYDSKKRKIKDERIRLAHENRMTKAAYENYIAKLKDVMERDYEKFAQ